MVHGDREMACRATEDSLLGLEDGLLHIFEYFVWRTQHTDDCMWA